MLWCNVDVGLGLSTFYTELMKGVGASSRLWELTDRTPSIRSSGKQICCKCILIIFVDVFKVA